MILSKLKNIFEEVLDIDQEKINEETYLIRDLGVESIDMLELSVHVSEKFAIEVNDQVMFLRHLRNHEEEGILKNYPYLREGRVKEILATLGEGPVLKISDVVDYILYQQNKYKEQEVKHGF